jgi:hypothetical protein
MLAQSKRGEHGSERDETKNETSRHDAELS